MKSSMKGKSADCMKKGGSVKEHKKEEKKEHKKEDKKPHFATGGGVKNRLDKAVRGKKATPGSPLSGAMPSGLPGGGKGESKPDKMND